MTKGRAGWWLAAGGAVGLSIALSSPAPAQLVDRNKAPNNANEGIAKSFAEQIGAGRGSVNTPDSSLFIINRDPARAIRRGRQLFQRKFTRAEGQGPLHLDGTGDLNDPNNIIIGAGLADSCAACHGRPRGAAGVGGDVVTRPDSRDAPHLFGLGLKEMLADEITAELRRIRNDAISEARTRGRNVRKYLYVRHGMNYGFLTARPDGSLDFSEMAGVDRDLRVRPFFLHGGTISMREFIVGAFNAEMGLEAADPDLRIAAAGGRVTTPSGMVLDGSQDRIEAPPATRPTDDPDGDGVTDEIPTSIVDFVEFYLLNYFKPGTGEQTPAAVFGRGLMDQIGCTGCHMANLILARDRRVADVQTTFDRPRGNPFNRLFATASLLLQEIPDSTRFPPIKRPLRGAFLVQNIFTDFKRHDLGPNFHEINYDGTIRREFLTTPLWGVGSTAPYGHDGRSINLTEVILRHGGEAQASRDAFALLSTSSREALLAFLNSLILFPPDDTPSNLNPANRNTAGYPQFGHGSINLAALFNDPSDPE